ncbi:ABC transporter substrate-binding protein [Aurantimonas endophytica]|uniref:NitT/TauT family transport system substrate-binding protein n=1 Tax=Aurantimonas endophytica TaxID=1522175 RepID=A0A7W6MQS0_9HYPH|nr:ABC transporter substrate-binding protein [Aurantimonas endophytica]MBB4004320.1 NitT/TauT family transport system substrate-binding protein [Aurantimonas endophytica]MCO6405160.1 ABC transporter substrate-binding protein [Aurantimonas endophytica]
MRWLHATLAASLALLVSTLCASAQQPAALETLRVGILQYGTVNWELDAMTRNGIDVRHGVDVELVPFAGEDPSNVALQAGAVDMIVSDWLWVSRQRAAGADFTFAPYSTSVGSIMVPGDSRMEALADLRGRTLGVAGGPLDKNWLLIQALAKRDGLDIAAENEIVYGAPPLLTAKAESGELDAVLNYWHYAARLEAQGFRTLISGTEAAMAMGTAGPVAAIGWVFRDSFAEDHPKAIEAFLAADAETKTLLRDSDEEWVKLAPLVKAENEKTLATLRDRYREGIPTRSAEDEIADTRALYRLLAEIGGERLVGPSPELVEGTYFTGRKNGA